MRASHGSRGRARQRSAPAPAAGAPRGGRLAVLLAAALPCVVYLRTMAPTVYGLDSAELSTGSYVLGIVHSPGSPTFLLLGHLFSWLPFGDVGYRVNLVSVVAAAAAMAAFAAVLLRLLRDPFAAAAGAWFLAFTYYVWVSAVAAELYSLQAFFLAMLIWLALGWRAEQRAWQLNLFALCFGLGLGNHLSLVVAAPGFAVLLRSQERHALPPLRRLAVAACCGLLGLAVYAYLPLRGDAPMNYARAFGVDVASWPGFWWMVTGQMFASQMFAVPLAELPAQAGSFAGHLFSNFVGVSALVGVVGLVDDARRRPDVHLGLAVIFLANLAWVVTYDVADKELMMLPTFLVWAIWIGLGVGPLTDLVARRTQGRIAIPAGALLLLLALANLLINFARVDLSRDWSARRRGEGLFAYLPPDALYVGGWGDVPILEYLQLVERQRPDVETLNIFLAPKPRRGEIVLRHLRAGRPVYAATNRDVPGIDAHFEYVPACECYAVRPAPAAPWPAASSAPG
ncbi:MAG: DUF2723 domain-containing protein [Deltaproteobacteria bacterium]|nr:DUF2723 domain-containing protein [Deltaproteobacteria bacterium]